jgi:hypothetical protein
MNGSFLVRGINRIFAGIFSLLPLVLLSGSASCHRLILSFSSFSWVAWLFLQTDRVFTPPLGFWSGPNLVTLLLLNLAAGFVVVLT